MGSERHPIRVLCYHAIADLAGAPVMEPYGVPARSFERQIRFLARRFRLIGPDDLLRFLDGGEVPRRAVLLTFDDCYRDLVEVGLPILRRHGAPAIAFAVTQRLGATNDWNADLGATQLGLADAAGLATLSDGSVAIGSHTRTHARLDRVSSDQLDGELRGSLADLERLRIGALPLVAYPHGAYDRGVLRAAREAGFAAAFTVEKSLVRPGHDRFRLPRLVILRSDGPLRFRWKVLWAGRSLRRRLSSHAP